MAEQRTKKKSRPKKKRKPAAKKDKGPYYKCMVCEYVPCICSSIGTWNRGW